MRLRPLLFLAVTGVSPAALLLGSACDSRPVVPIDDEEDARGDVVPATPEAGVPADGAAGDAAKDANPADAADLLDASDDADAMDGEADAS